MPPTPDAPLLRRIRWLLAIVIIGLLASGLTAFPLQGELDMLTRVLGIEGGEGQFPHGGLFWWLAHARDGLRTTYAAYPFVAYGTDWLAFAHLVLALLFIGPWRDPVKNIWVIDFGLMACALVIPLALICGAMRGIPFYWRLIDCSFGVLGAVPLWLARRATLQLARQRA
jgi:hypothetical protein